MTNLQVTRSGRAPPLQQATTTLHTVDAMGAGPVAPRPPEAADGRPLCWFLGLSSYRWDANVQFAGGPGGAEAALPSAATDFAVPKEVE